MTKPYNPKLTTHDWKLIELAITFAHAHCKNAERAAAYEALLPKVRRHLHVGNRAASKKQEGAA